MRSLTAILAGEILKIRRSPVFPLTLAAMCLAPVFGAIFVVVLTNPALEAGNEALRAKAAMSGFTGDWPSFFNLISQALGIGGIIVFGFVAAWIFGREHSDHTVKDLLVLPVRRSTIVIAKTIASLLWCMSISIVVICVSLLTGFLLGLEGWTLRGLNEALVRAFIASGLAALLTPPVAFIASVAKGYLGALGFVILTMVLSQVVASLGYGAYVPWAVPALYAGIGSEAGGSLNIMSYIIVALTSVTGLGATLLWWICADQTE